MEAKRVILGMKMNEMELINKVGLLSKAKSIRRTMMKLAISFCLVIIAIMLLVNREVLPSVFPIIGMLAVNMSGFSNEKKLIEEYQNVPCKVSFSGDSLVIQNFQINRYDKKGPYTEEITFPYAKMQGAEYDDVIKAVCITGQGKKITTWTTAKGKNRKKKKSIRSTELYTTRLKKDDILNAIADNMAKQLMCDFYASEQRNESQES